MPSFHGPSRPARRRAWRAMAVALVVVAALLAGFYAALPWLVNALAPRLAGPLGVDELRVVMGRPGLRGVAVESLALVRGPVHLTATGGRIGWRPGELFAGRLGSIRFERMHLRMDAPPEAGTTSPAAPPGLDELFAGLPAEQVAVRSLTLEVPALEFRATGHLMVRGSSLDVHLEGLAPKRADDFELDVRAAAEGGVRALVGRRGSHEPPYLTVTSELHGERVTVDGELDVRGFALDLLAALAGLESGDGRVNGSFSAEFPWASLGDREWDPLRAEGRLRGGWATSSWAVGDAVADWRLEAGVLVGRVTGTVRTGGHSLTVRASADELALDTVAGSGELTLAASADESPLARMEWALNADELAVSGELELDEAAFAAGARGIGLPGRGALAGTLSARLPWPLPESWRSLRPPAEGSLAGEWRLEDGTFGVSGLDVGWRLEDGRLSGSFDALVSYAGLTGRARARLETLTLNDGTLSARGTAGLGEAVRLPFDASHDLEGGRGGASISGEILVDEPLIETVVDDWDAPYDVTSGRLALEAELGWTRSGGPLDGNVRLGLDRLDAHYRDYMVTGLAGDLTLVTGEGGTWSLEPSALRISAVDTGVEVRDVSTGVAWSGSRVTVQDTTAKLLGGTARIAPFAYELDEGEADLVVDLADVELARVLALEGEHVAGTGILDGTLPVHVRAHQVSIVAGQIRSDPPGGVIRLAPALAAGAGQPGLDFALRALEDFRYSVLEADVTYSPEGDLTLAVRLQGRNPEIEGGRPIHYNVTVNENLPTLLQSLRLEDQVTREIERRVTD